MTTYTEVMNKLDKRAEKNGEETVLQLLTEECAEVIQAISKYQRNRTREDEMHIHEELADVTNLKMQLQHLSDKSEDFWSDYTMETINNKLDRQDERDKELEDNFDPLYSPKWIL